jgi:hypothetical protein
LFGILLTLTHGPGAARAQDAPEEILHEIAVHTYGRLKSTLLNLLPAGVVKDATTKLDERIAKGDYLGAVDLIKEERKKAASNIEGPAQGGPGAPSFEAYSFFETEEAPAASLSRSTVTSSAWRAWSTFTSRSCTVFTTRTRPVTTSCFDTSTCSSMTGITMSEPDRATM